MPAVSWPEGGESVGVAVGRADVFVRPILAIRIVRVAGNRLDGSLDVNRGVAQFRLAAVPTCSAT
jgi:hypothetical protein